MLERAIAWTWVRYRPREGWFPLFLLVGVVISLVMAVVEADWVPEADVVGLTAMLGLFMGVLLAKRPLRGSLAWLFILIYGLLLTTIRLAELRPPLPVLLDGWGPTSEYWRQSGALFLDRMASWFEAVFSGGRSYETIVFAFGLGFLSWLLAAYVGWSAYRLRRPLLGLSAMGLALAANGYYGDVAIWWAALFVAFTVLLAALLNFTNLEHTWSVTGVDFSDQIRLDLIFYASGSALVLLLVALILPSFRISTLSRLLLNNPVVEGAEDSLERAFAGVRQPQGGGPGPDVEGLTGSAGGMPRSYLLGDPPELYETVVMEATVTITGEDGNETVPPRPLTRNTHWRGPSYDVYTGRGWALSSERQERVAAGDLIPLPPVLEQITVLQSVDLLLGQPIVRYTLGLPLRFDQDVAVHWRGLTDLSWVEGDGLQYQATSFINSATPAQLQGAALSSVPDLILARYTELPATVPVRVHELAQSIGGELSNPYDQARALERFLRQYQYSLNVELPPANVDPVDFFLFEQQAGYCDYYSSAMTVMARALGLPARVGVGFLAQPPDENGVQTIYQINGHSWSEIYFAGYGWVEFEPTAAFASPHEESNPLFDRERPDFGDLSGEDLPDTLAIPEPEPRRPFPWDRLLLLAVVTLILWLWQRRRSKIGERDKVLWAYDRLQRQALHLGYPVSSSQTPLEFCASFLTRLRSFSDRPQLEELVEEMGPHIEGITGQYILRQYSQKKQLGAAVAADSWRRLNWPFWLLRLIRVFSGRRPGI
jgi:transglutaminase-like putative cysteine protease